MQLNQTYYRTRANEQYQQYLRYKSLALSTQNKCIRSHSLRGALRCRLDYFYYLNLATT